MCVMDSPEPQASPAKAQPIINRRPSRLRLSEAARGSLAGEGQGVGSLTNASKGRNLNLNQSSLNIGSGSDTGLSVEKPFDIQRRISDIEQATGNKGGVVGKLLGKAGDKMKQKARKDFESQLKIKPTGDGE